MIRVYLDWNVVSNFKRDEFKDIREFIAKNKKSLQFPYTPAHFKDLMKSYRPDNDLFGTDLESLEYLSENHFMRWGKEGMEILMGSPKDYLEIEKDSEDIFSQMDMEKILNDLGDNELGRAVGGLMKSLFQLQPAGIEVTDENREMLQKMFPNLSNSSSMWDLMKGMVPFSQKLHQDREYYKDFRKSIGEKGFKLEPASGNWNVETVVKNIDQFLERLNTKLTFREYINTCFKHKKEPATGFEYYTTAYLMLDMLGYKPDKLPKTTDSMQNIQADGQHSFYSAYCDYFVVDDTKLRIKTQVLFKEFNIPTIVLESNEFIKVVKDKLHINKEGVHFINEAVELLEAENIVEYYESNNEDEGDTRAFKLPVFYFDFFNYAIYEWYPKQEGFALIFKKVFKNYSSFVYYTECERVIDRVTSFFGYDNKEELERKKKEFVYGESEVKFFWTFDGGVVILEKDKENKRPLLTYVVATKQKESVSEVS
ncbi:hypothetical protein [Hymenobacter arizonensis]|uniref:Uncharacterized protein n=1 Tax=Hymenobacter arizonensis TaxID=1227077 RepID=A0A1I6BMM4_HYMAR|nr:hypothetical protein [Hymenobacter arizonensis]SFQ82165.1 hypothetical protein SAMN04515668_4749 [Hymenobacter arizonensis]